MKSERFYISSSLISLCLQILDRHGDEESNTYPGRQLFYAAGLENHV